MHGPDGRAPQGLRATGALLTACALLCFAGCQTNAGGKLVPLTGEARALAEARAGAAAAAASRYVGLAATAAGSERERLTLLAIEQWLIAGDEDRARSAQASLTQPADAANAALATAVRARFLLGKHDPEQALILLEPLSAKPMTPARRAVVEQLRAATYRLLGQPARSVEIMRQREAWLADGETVARGREALWALLRRSSTSELRDAANDVMDPEVRGWLSLAALATATGQQGISWNNGVLRWRDRHPGHPAQDLLDALPKTGAEMLRYPRQVALLLPLSGRNAGAAAAIRNGFLGAYFANAGGMDDRQSVRVYDIAREGGATAAYDRATRDGAEFVVGPLLQSSVAELANNSLVAVPVLALNTLDDGSAAPPGLYQFALSPEDEAAAAAQRAIADGHTRAVALVPNSAWGRRLLAAFASEFESGGGILLDTRTYVSGQPDYSGVIENLMELSGSIARYTRLRANIGGRLQFDPRRRQDVQLVFLAADAASGRLMKSQLKFHYSGDLPVYATSLIYALDERSNADLNGVRFADVPWVIAPPPWIRYLPKVFADYFPGEKRLARLHALGYDAYQLTGNLFAFDGAHRATLLNGATGQLYLDADGRVHRRLSWAEFINGNPTPLEPAATTEDDAEGSVPADEREWRRDDAPISGVL